VASLIKPGTVKVLTKDGEVQVSLTIDLNINLNSHGLSINAEGTAVESDSGASFGGSAKKEEKFEWAIPDFEEAPKINFGKKEV